MLGDTEKYKKTIKKTKNYKNFLINEEKYQNYLKNPNPMEKHDNHSKKMGKACFKLLDKLITKKVDVINELNTVLIHLKKFIIQSSQFPRGNERHIYPKGLTLFPRDGNNKFYLEAYKFLKEELWDHPEKMETLMLCSTAFYLKRQYKKELAKIPRGFEYLKKAIVKEIKERIDSVSLLYYSILASLLNIHNTRAIKDFFDMVAITYTYSE